MSLCVSVCFEEIKNYIVNLSLSLSPSLFFRFVSFRSVHGDPVKGIKLSCKKSSLKYFSIDRRCLLLMKLPPNPWKVRRNYKQRKKRKKKEEKAKRERKWVNAIEKLEIGSRRLLAKGDGAICRGVTFENPWISMSTGGARAPAA